MICEWVRDKNSVCVCVRACACMSVLERGGSCQPGFTRLANKHEHRARELLVNLLMESM